MQVIAPVTTDQLLQKGQQPLLKFEILYCCCWVDLTSYLKKGSLSISTAGAEMTPRPIAGKWSATIFNKNGMFDPDEPGYAPYNEYFRVGVKVKISVGARYGGVDYYWRRIYGFMDLPNFSIHKSEVSLSGFDNTQFLADTKMKEPDNYWGSSQTFSTGDPEGTFGPEIYVEEDAMDTDDAGHNTVAPWNVRVDCTFVSVDPATSGQSLFEGRADTTDMDARIENPNVGNATIGDEYRVTFWYKKFAGSALPMKVNVYQDIGGNDTRCGGKSGLAATDWTKETFYFTALKTGILIMKLIFQDTGQQFRIDDISIMKYDDPLTYQYDLPVGATGVHYVELDEGAGFESVWPGRQKKDEEGWFYNSEDRYLYFADGKRVEQGTDNLIIHYYTVQIPEEVVADLLARAGLYDNQAEALAAMIYTATSITIDKVWFKSGSTCLNAVKMLCERCNYRFYFNYGQRPVFKAAPTSSNLLTDGGLNEWLSATNLEHWTESIAGTSTVNREATEKIEGTYSCRLDVDAGNSIVYIHQGNISLTPLKRYKLVIWYMNSVAGKTTDFTIRDSSGTVYLKEDDTWNVGYYGITLPNSTIWKKYELFFHAHPDYSSYYLHLVRKFAASSFIYFDKLSIWREDFTFNESHITNIRDYEDRNEIKNLITIEGIEQALPEGAEETKPSKFKGEASEVASINKYGEHTWPIKNHLFQDQATIDAYCAIYLAAFKDPKWYTTFDIPFNPVPLEKGDGVTWRKKYEAGGTPIDQRGIIRDIQINEYNVTYKIEKVA